MTRTSGVPERVLEREVWLPRAITPVFGFFADAANLNGLTPPWLHLRIVTPAPINMRAGAIIDYRIRLHGVPIRWRTQITVWSPPTRFTDEQVRGPYTKWVHEHIFEPCTLGGRPGTRCIDRVTYAHAGGELLERCLVRPDLNRIFDYREARFKEWLGQPLPPTPAVRSDSRTALRILSMELDGGGPLNADGAGP